MFVNCSSPQLLNVIVSYCVVHIWESCKAESYEQNYCSGQFLSVCEREGKKLLMFVLVISVSE